MPLSLLTRSLPALALLATASAHAAGVTELHATGVQIYRCDKTAWTLQGPDATLTDIAGKPAGHHFKGPTWQSTDGSRVAGKPVAAGAAPQAGSVPWLVVQATAHSGAGLFQAVTYIIRSQTIGGAAPATGCDTAHQGAEARVPYTATYTLFGTAPR